MAQMGVGERESQQGGKVLHKAL
ncbi:MAG: hypothetical protein K0R40_1373, partial [Burkholderiales bacterium]|nr:hypothetical protein [Burkholderiales bacterium]